MSATTNPTTGSTADSALTQRIDQLYRELAAQRRRTDQSATVTALVGGVILLGLAGYFYFGYTQFSEVTRPERIVQAAETIVNDNLPVARKAIEEEVNRSAPVWAESLSKQAQNSMPTARKKLEEYVTAEVDKTLNQGLQLTEEQFRTFLQNNRATIERSMKELASNPTLAEETINELVNSLEKQLKGDLQMKSRELFTALNLSNEKVKKLQSNLNLTPGEHIERRLLMLARRLQMQALPSSGGSSAAPVAAATRTPAKPTEGSTAAAGLTLPSAPAVENQKTLPPSNKSKGKTAD